MSARSGFLFAGEALVLRRTCVMGRAHKPALNRYRSTMNSQHCQTAEPRRSFSIITVFLLALLSLRTGEAGSATWLTNPVSGDWNNGLNWSAGGPPNGTADTATFNSSTITSISFSAFTTVDGIIYNPGASVYTLTTSLSGRLTLDGVGITNNSGVTQNFVSSAISGQGGFTFSNSASAGTQGLFTNSGGMSAGQAGGFIEFFNSSTAANSAYINKGGAVSGAFGGFIEFNDTSSAASATYTNEAGVPSAQGGFINFFGSSSGGDAVFVCNGGTASGANAGYIHFFNSSNAGSGMIVANGGTNGGGGTNLEFQNDSTGGTVRLQLFGNSLLDLFNHTTVTPMTLGSLEGDGSVFIYGSNLILGGNNLSTLFSGTISDAGAGGRLTKNGTGTLTLAGTNTYTGGTTVNAGVLLVQRSSGSGTGTGIVQVTAGTIGGTGRIGGAVTLGNGTGARAFLAPGTNGIGTLTIQQKLTCKADATYNFQLHSSRVTSDKVIARGVTINSGAMFSASDLANSTLVAGTNFVAISNAAGSPISGVFSNLADGSILTVGSNTFLVDYEGGDGNDLVLTVQ